MFDQAFDAAQGFGQRKQVAALQHAARFLQAALDLDADNAAEAVHLALGQRVLRVALEAGVDHAFDGRVLFQPLGKFQRVRAMGLHAQVQGFQAAHGEEGIERAGDGTDRVLQEGQAFGQFIGAGDDDAADNVGVAIDVLGGRVHYQIRAEFQRALHRRAAEGVVHHQQQAVLLGKRGNLGEIHQLEQRVGRRLGPDHAGVGFECSLERGGVIQIDETEIKPRAAPAHALEQAVGAAVEVVHGDHVAAGVDQFQRGRCCGHAAGEGEAGDAALEAGNATLVRHARGVLRARVLVTLVLARALLHVGGGGVDRRHDGAGRGIGVLAGVDGAGAETKVGRLRFLGHEGCAWRIGPRVDRKPLSLPVAHIASLTLCSSRATIHSGPYARIRISVAQGTPQS